MPMLNKVKELYAGAALIAAIVIGLLSYYQTKDVTANILILVAQFLMYSLTLLGFGEIVNQIIKMRNNSLK